MEIREEVGGGGGCTGLWLWVGGSVDEWEWLIPLCAPVGFLASAVVALPGLGLEVKLGLCCSCSSGGGVQGVASGIEAGRSGGGWRRGGGWKLEA